MRKTLLAIVFALLILVQTCLSEAVIEPGEDFYYYDEAGVLSEDTKREIYALNTILFESCGAQIVVAVLHTTGDAGVEKYSYDLFNSWGIGDAKANNGFLLLLSIDQEDYYARTGIGLERLMSNETVAKYLDDYLEADFAAGRYDDGVRCFFEHVLPYIAELYHATFTMDQALALYHLASAPGANAR